MAGDTARGGADRHRGLQLIRIYILRRPPVARSDLVPGARKELFAPTTTNIILCVSPISIYLTP